MTLGASWRWIWGELTEGVVHPLMVEFGWRGVEEGQPLLLVSTQNRGGGGVVPSKSEWTRLGEAPIHIYTPLSMSSNQVRGIIQSHWLTLIKGCSGNGRIDHSFLLLHYQLRSIPSGNLFPLLYAAWQKKCLCFFSFNFWLLLISIFATGDKALDVVTSWIDYRCQEPKTKDVHINN